MKKERQDAIVRLVNQYNIQTQEELISYLEKEGFNTTQTTISRDIRELKLTKITYDGNKHKYAVGIVNSASTSKSYRQVLGNCVISMEQAENIIVIKTVSGMAMAVGASIDSLKIPGIVGCIAGDDTLFLAIKHSNLADEIIGEIKNVAKYAY